MSLQLILGNSGAGKTHLLYQQVINQSIEYPDRNFLVIVPEQYTMQTQKELVERHPRGGILNIDVLSFGRLAHRIFSELGITQGVVLDDEGKNLILRKIAGDYENDLKIIGKNLKKFGYISEVKSVISEFAQYHVSLGMVEELKGKFQSMLSYKLEDIYKVYDGFQTYLEGRYITSEEMLDTLSQVVGNSKILKDSVITFDGFTGFTPVQYELMGRLLKQCATMYVTVTIEEKAKPYEYQHPYELFGLSKETVCKMSQLAAKCEVKEEPPITLFQQPTFRYKNQEALGFLEENLFRYGGKKYEKPQEEIQLMGWKTPQEEAMGVGEIIRHFVRTKGYRYRDIAILTTNMDVYGTYLDKASGAYDIPMFSDQTRSILLNSFIEYIRSLLSMLAENYSYQSVFRHLKAGVGEDSYLGTSLGELNHDMVDQMENYVLEFGIKGRKKWKEPWAYTSLNVSSIQLEALNKCREIWMLHLETLSQTLQKRGKTVEEIGTALYEFFVENQLEEKIEKRALHFGTQGLFALEKEYSQIYGVFLDLLDKLVGILGEEKVTLKEFIELLDAGLEEARIGIIPPTIDQVLVGDLQRTRVDHIKALFFVGVSDTYLPGKMGGTGFLSEQDRDRLLEEHIRLKPGAKEQMYLQKFYLYLNLTKPTEHLIVSYAKSGGDGKSGRPAYLIGELQKLYPLLECEDSSNYNTEEGELTGNLGLSYLIEGFHNPKLQETPLWKARYAWYEQNQQWKQPLKEAKEAYYYKRLQENLPKDLTQGLYGTVLKNSVSRLEKFAACPYAHFLNYGLKLKERELYEFEASDVGTVLHAAMDRFSTLVTESQLGWKHISEEQQVLWADQAVDESVSTYEHDLFHQSKRDEYMVNRFKRMMHKTVWAVIEQLKAGQFEPKGFEVKFGFEDSSQSSGIGRFSLTDSQEMQLRGLIDRVDLYEKEETQEVMVKIVDYKSSKKDVDWNDLYYGLQLQLFVYLDTALKLQGQAHPDKLIIPAGCFYYHVDDPILEANAKKTMEEVALSELKVSGLVNEVAITAMDEEFEYTSNVIPVGRTKTTGNWTAGSKHISPQDLDLLLEYTAYKVEDLGKEIAQGNIAIGPYQYKSGTAKANGCSYCEYKRICEFDPSMSEFSYHSLEPREKEEIMEHMCKDLEKGEKGRGL